MPTRTVRAAGARGTNGEMPLRIDTPRQVLKKPSLSLGAAQDRREQSLELNEVKRRLTNDYMRALRKGQGEVSLRHINHCCGFYYRRLSNVGKLQIALRPFYP